MYQCLTQDLVLRKLERDDVTELALYFDSLSEASKRRFQPHASTRDAALNICTEEDFTTARVVIEREGKIIAYVILEPNVSTHEIGRYSEFGIALKPGEDFMFAPSVLDDFQNTGIASMAMPYLIELARRKGARSLVLMGGTQASNARVIAFYEKFGFERFGGCDAH